DLAADPQCSAGQVDAHRLVVAEGSLEGEPFALIVEDHADECPDVCLECAALRVEHGGPRSRLILPQPCEHVVEHAGSHLTEPPTVRLRRCPWLSGHARCACLPQCALESLVQCGAALARVQPASRRCFGAVGCAYTQYVSEQVAVRTAAERLELRRGDRGVTRPRIERRTG